jgi:hypothetical protein
VNETKERVIIKTKRPHIALWNPLICANLAFAVPESHPKFSPVGTFRNFANYGNMSPFSQHCKTK